MSLRQHSLLFAVLFCIFVLFCQPAQALKTLEGSVKINDPGLAAAEAAAENGQFLMVLFQKTGDHTPVNQSFESVKKTISPTVASIAINTAIPDQSYLVEKYNIHYAPLPMVVIIAPNGAVTGSFNAEFNLEQVKAKLVSPATQQCLLALQQQKIVFLCIQGETTADKNEALAGVNLFREDPKVGKISDVVIINPEDPREKSLLTQLRVGSDPAVAETILLAPPGKILGKWSGPTSKTAITNALLTQLKAQNSCQIPDCGDPTCETPDKGGVK